LLVEDNLVNQKMTAIMLRKEGYIVEVASNGLEALNKCKIETYAIIFMDCQMPVMDGFEATTAIRKLPENISKVPIIALTANAFEGFEQLCLNSNMTGYLSKPTKKAELLKMIYEYCSKGNK